MIMWEPHCLVQVNRELLPVLLSTATGTFYLGLPRMPVEDEIKDIFEPIADSASKYSRSQARIHLLLWGSRLPRCNHDQEYENGYTGRIVKGTAEAKTATILIIPHS